MLIGYQSDENTLNLLSTVFIKFFFEGKFYVMFSLLFGYGFFIFMNKPTEEGRSILPVYLRRVFFLLIFGILHVVLLFSKGKLSTMAKLLSPVGRMALTNYLLHSIICTTLFYSYGFGLFGKINTFQGILLSIIIFALQVPLSRWWLRNFHYGPFEWLWRSLTYMKVQPFRKLA